MSNPITEKIKTGTIGELLVQLRLLQYNVQAAPPIKDSGNDLIAIKGNTFKTIQVKTSEKSTIKATALPERYDILALVCLEGENNQIRLDDSKIFLLSEEEVTQKSYSVNKLEKKESNKELGEARIKELFP